MERAKQSLKWNQRSEVTKTLFVIAIIVGVTLGGYGIFTVAMGTSSPLVVVESESMLPTLEVGHLLVLQHRAPNQIQIGDIIVFHAHYHPKPIVHRVISHRETIMISSIKDFEFMRISLEWLYLRFRI
jgi:signal peptidase I